MGTATRQTPTFIADTPAKASEVNAELDHLVLTLNNIENVNVTAAADIAESKIDDISDTVVNARADLTAGNSASPTVNGKLEAEIKRLRRQLRQLSVGLAADWFTDASVQTDCGWQELPIRGANKFSNSSFEVHTAGASEAPDGWVEVGTGATLTTQTTPVSEGKGLDVLVRGNQCRCRGTEADRYGYQGQHLLPDWVSAHVNRGRCASGDYG